MHIPEHLPVTLTHMSVGNKVCICCCGHAGSTRPLPRFTSPKVRSMLDMPDLKAYSDLANAYGHDNPDKLLRVAEQHMTTFSSVSSCMEWRVGACGKRLQACGWWPGCWPWVMLAGQR